MRPLTAIVSIVAVGCASGEVPETLPDLWFESLPPAADSPRFSWDALTGGFRYERAPGPDPQRTIGDGEARAGALDFVLTHLGAPVEVSVKVAPLSEYQVLPDARFVTVTQQFEGVDVLWCSTELSVDERCVRTASGRFCRLTAASAVRRPTPSESSAFGVFLAYVAPEWELEQQPDPGAFELTYMPARASILQDAHPVLHPQRRLQRSYLFVDSSDRSAWSLGSCNGLSEYDDQNGERRAARERYRAEQYPEEALDPSP